MSSLPALLTLAGAFSLLAGFWRPRPAAAPDPASEADEAATDIAARVVGVALLALAALVAWS
ncbi:hypothetical protein [uncultured Amaricoccus sp.]|uniref:hypothetical protein n=1 Tax=uncultured Amaricoccus sp. TaxID=339341 RepID=UPI00261DFA59|nr:hypothetical protein [uncultured Amaricoccus sp.]